MQREEEQAPGVPEWIVTFGDMMSLLLTFFIMLVAMSEIKEDEKFQAMVDSMRQEFGHEATIMPVPGETVPRNSNMIHTASAGRARRRDTVQGGAKVKAVLGENPRVLSSRMGKHALKTGIVQFHEEKTTLTDEAKQQLQQMVSQIAGKPHRIEIRGHTTRRPLSPNSTMRDKYDLAYERSRIVKQFLVEQGIDPERIRLGAAADNEPAYDGTDIDQLRRNARVQVMMWDEPVGLAE
jgi:chemotaxis protein MotB